VQENEAMKIASVVMMLGLPLAAAAGEVKLSEADQVAVTQAALDYAEGWYTGDRARMERSLHGRLAKRAYLPGKDGKRALDEMDKTTLLAGNQPENAQRYADKPKRAEVEILDGFHNAASVKLTMDGWVDYMHLARTESGEWRIVNVLWELTSP
jgi:hypothetical protein